MKKILIGLAVLAALGLQATASDELKTNMDAMRDGLQSIQDGFSYNNKSAILSGIAKIQKANNMFHDEKSAGKFLPKGKQKFSKIAFLSTHSLNSNLEQMKEYVNLGKIVDASDSISGIVHSCTRCHAIVRGW